jgi:hypothetical protein
MGCLLNSGINVCKDYSLGGIKRLFITNKEWITDYFFDVSDTELSQITSFSTSSSYLGWYEFQVTKTFLNAFENLEISGQKNLFVKNLDATFIKLDSTKRGVLKKLLNAKTVVAFIDNNNNWWVIGEDTGCKSSEYKAQTSTIDGTSDYRVLLTSKGKYQMRSIDNSYAYTYIAGETTYDCDCETLITYPLYISANCELSPLASCPLQ